MPDNTIGWGQGAANNSIGWGAGAVNNNLNWGKIHGESYGHDETNLTGVLTFFDEEGTPSLGYSLMDLGGSSLNAIRSRRGADNAERDDTSGTIADGSFLSWVQDPNPVGGAAIRTFYNIGSEASADLEQTSAAVQPIIVTSGVLETIGSDPAINFGASFTCLFNTGGFSFLGYSETFSIDIDFETASDVSTRNMILAQRNGANDRFGLTIFAGRLYVEGFNGAYAGSYYNVSASTRYKLTIVWNNGSNTVYLNGSALTPDGSSVGLLGSVSNDEFVLGNDRTAGSSNPFLGKINSLLAYSEAKDGTHNTAFTNAY